MPFTDIVQVLEIMSELEIQSGMDSSLVYHVDVIYLPDLRRTRVVTCNESVIKF